MARKTKAAAYIRMSTDDQADSPEQQKQQIIERFGDRYSIRWYADLGISGDDTKNRPQFQRMREDALAKDFEAILAWDVDRLSRNDVWEFGYWFHEIRNTGIYIETCNQGLVDLNDSSNAAIIHPIIANQNHAYLRKLSTDVDRGMQKLARDGKWGGGRPPLGYVIGSDQKLHLDIPEMVELVQSLFRDYANGSTLRALVHKLQSYGIRRSRQSVRTILINPVYLGHISWGRTSFSK